MGHRHIVSATAHPFPLNSRAFPANCRWLGPTMAVAASAVVAVDGHGVTALLTPMLHQHHILLVAIPKVLQTIKQSTWLHLQANMKRRAPTSARGGRKFACV